MNDFRIKMTLTMISPTLSQGMEGKKLGIDTAAWLQEIIQNNNEVQKRPALPASLIRGNLLHSWKQLAKITASTWISDRKINELLGSEAESSTYNPNYASLRMPDYWLAEKPIDESRLHRITINPDTGTVKKGMLQVLEIPHPVGAEVKYSGSFEIALANNDEAEILRTKIEKAFKFIPALGAFKGIGFGRIKSVDVDSPVLQTTDLELSIDDDDFGLEVTLDRPFCFAKPHPEQSNLFSSLDYIPGAAIKGAIARRIKQLGTPSEFVIIVDYLSQIRFTHAQPDTADGKKTRRSAIPLSLVYCDGKFFDASLQTLNKTSEIKFQIDWKNPQWEIVTGVFRGKNVPAPEHELRVRTKINMERNSAEDEALFSYESIKTDKHVWRSNVSLQAKDSEKSEAVKKALSKLFALGLNGLGKTRACTQTIKINKPFPFTVGSNDLIENRKVRLVLQSDTLLLPPDLKIPPTNGDDELKKAYAAAWDGLANNEHKILVLSDYYTTQRLFGGSYFWRRFQNSSAIYKPYILTEAGSVFIFKVLDEEKAKIILAQWLQQGLPVPKCYPNNWEKNPILPENGYGEIQLNPNTITVCNQLNNRLPT